MGFLKDLLNPAPVITMKINRKINELITGKSPATEAMRRAEEQARDDFDRVAEHDDEED